MAGVLLLLGALASVTGAALITWPAGVITVGVLLLLAGIDLRR